MTAKRIRVLLISILSGLMTGCAASSTTYHVSGPQVYCDLERSPDGSMRRVCCEGAKCVYVP